MCFTVELLENISNIILFSYKINNILLRHFNKFNLHNIPEYWDADSIYMKEILGSWGEALYQGWISFSLNSYDPWRILQHVALPTFSSLMKLLILHELQFLDFLPALGKRKPWFQRIVFSPSNFGTWVCVRICDILDHM